MEPDWKPVAEGLASLYDRYEDIGKAEVVDQVEEALKEAYSKGWTAHWKAITDSETQRKR